MQGLAILLYATFTIVYWLLAVFIIYHIRKYILDRTLGYGIIIIFLVIMGALFLVNVTLFLSLPREVFSSFDGLTR